MIAYLRGTIDTLTPTNAYVDCSGVGYDVNISLSTYDTLHGLEREAPVRLWITEVMRQGEVCDLYGFYTREEQALFAKLISVSGVGPATARVILSSLAPQELVEVIESGDDKRLKTVKGIGLKTAQRIIVDLKGKLPETLTGREVAEEAISALKMLGFAEANVRKVVKQIMTVKPDTPVEQVIKQALAQL
ncbi:MAG: Holliday junction branch migration protein RuvA [Porphyromonas sp.]|uniref:Holliday junction branch migration protein RuvA n=1 Tax=Porphyromonas sp. TaxID=1924944 RepID=UPI001A443C9F|nr:Holliday junction branch migration protein RuvA [Porphyromonas sp.]MBL6452590.1 Holliday junction branch migration protein RuvA [Porphyromonas sp.]